MLLLAAGVARADVTAPGAEQPPAGDAVPFRVEGLHDDVSIGSARFRLHNLRDTPLVIEVARLAVGSGGQRVPLDVQSLLVTSLREKGALEPVIGPRRVRLAARETIDLLVWAGATNEAELAFAHDPALALHHEAAFSAPPQPALPRGFAVGARDGDFPRDPPRSRGWDGERIRGLDADPPVRPARNRRPHRAAPE